MSSEIKSSSLISIAEDSLALERLILEESGELDETLEKWLAEVETNLSVKVDSYQFTMERFESTAMMLRTRSVRIMNAAKALENARERLRDRIKLAMQLMGKDEVLGTEVKFKLGKSAPKLVIDENKIPTSYLMAETVYSVDKKRVLDELKTGSVIPGAKLEAVVSLRSGINKNG